jgi:hypothetical protein
VQDRGITEKEIAMRAKLVGGLLAAAALLIAAPAWAGGGHGHGHGHRHGHKHWNKHPARHYHPHYAPRHYVVREYWQPAPVYAVPVYPAYPAPAPGVHIVLPGIHIPIR